MCLNSTEKSFGKDAIVGVKKHARSKEDLRVMILIKFSRKQYDKFAQMAEELKEYMRNNRTGVALIIDTDPYTLWRN